MIERKKTKTVSIGNLKIGYDNPIAIQSMTNTDTSSIKDTVAQINKLKDEGCEIIRVAVKNTEAALAITQIKKEITMPIVADIHFDYKLAVESIKAGADKIRINPGNIQDVDAIEQVIDCAEENGVPIRVGVNSGSLESLQEGAKNQAEIMVNSLLKYLEVFENKNFYNIVVSLKSSHVADSVEAYRMIADKCDYPIHLGITAAGTSYDGIIKSSIGIGTLLLDGIGDTIRVSLTGDPVDEIGAAKSILSSIGVRRFGHEIISCPTCGRCQVDLVSRVKEFERKLKQFVAHDSQFTTKPLTIAIMGCEVNGPGEAKTSDIGIAFGDGRGAIFHKGKVVKTVDEAEAIDELLRIIEEIGSEIKGQGSK